MLDLRGAINLFLNEQIATTRKSYFYNLRDLRAYLGDERPLTDITTEDMIRFSQHFRGKPGVKSPATYNKCIKTVRTFFNWCIKSKLMPPPSPAAAVKRMKQSQVVSRDKSMPNDTYLQLLDYAKWDPRAYALVLFLGDTGCRIGGAAGLRWGDVYFLDGSAVVTEKGTPERHVFFGDECSKALMQWQQRQREKRRGEFVFSVTGKRMTNDSLGQFFSRQCHAAQIGVWGPHSLRHRKGHQMADAKVAPTTAQLVLGHADVSTTLEHYYPRDWDRAHQVVKELSFQRTNLEPVNPRILKDNERTG
jgi:integrase/recombinase XerC